MVETSTGYTCSRCKNTIKGRLKTYQALDKSSIPNKPKPFFYVCLCFGCWHAKFFTIPYGYAEYCTI